MNQDTWWAIAYYHPSLFPILYEHNIYCNVPSYDRSDSIDKNYISFRIGYPSFDTLLGILKNSCIEIYPLWPDRSLVVTMFNEEILDDAYQKGKKGFLRDYGYE